MHSDEKQRSAFGPRNPKHWEGFVPGLFEAVTNCRRKLHATSLSSERAAHHYFDVAVCFCGLEEFRTEPSSVRLAQGETALLECGPPRGHPEPTVFWKKNGQVLEMDNPKRFSSRLLFASALTAWWMDPQIELALSRRRTHHALHPAVDIDESWLPQIESKW
ncbi:Roundabout 1 [Homalodisca vitripennis]|nr:Roundabout 1 [Homalodisca vitripennis]